MSHQYSNLDQLLEELGRDFKPGSTTGRMTSARYDIPVLKKEIKALFLELIGEDLKPGKNMSDYGYDQLVAENKLLAELRKKVEEL